MLKLLNKFMPKKKKAKILIVEDEQALRRHYDMVLSSDYELDFAQTGKQGLEKAQNIPDLIMLDINLPEISGVEILKHLKKDEKTADIPVLVLTNLSDEETVSKIIKAGGKDYMVKADWSVEDIAKKIQELI